MIIKPKFTPAQVGQILQKKVDNIEAAVLSALSRIAEAYVTRARNATDKIKNYEDKTGNLRSSIGYVILKDGQQVYGGLPGTTPEGRAKAKSALDNAKQRHKKGWVLIVVAGMEYASALESGRRHGYTVPKRDVITVSSYPVEGDIKTAIERIKKKLS